MCLEMSTIIHPTVNKKTKIQLSNHRFYQSGRDSNVRPRCRGSVAPHFPPKHFSRPTKFQHVTLYMTQTWRALVGVSVVGPHFAGSIKACVRLVVTVTTPPLSPFSFIFGTLFYHYQHSFFFFIIWSFS